MDLLRRLQIDAPLIGPEARESLLLAEGSRREPWALVAALEKRLQRCKSLDIWYAPVLLQRKKALERGTWRVPQEFRSAQSPGRPAEVAATARGACSDARKNSDDGKDAACAKCGDTGIRCLPGGHSASAASISGATEKAHK
jgi:hypothetical protein